ncbi:DUF6545 domain-containing protein [Actinomadura atramentaria]|uniref:DUF6545 domain-containing protein n=1 Tax=Actinomadura atramentaria TaxID=1990 RepID=UPI000376BB47|nr:DUF6545 domain-containing protein [Actinomadura atramentaria]
MGLTEALPRLAALAFGALAPTAAETYRQWRVFRRLGPLWRAMYAAFPDIRLPIHARSMRICLYRRIIEIRDGQLAARPYVDDACLDSFRAAGRARGLSGPDLDAAVEAAVITVSLRKRMSGADPVRPRSPGALRLASDDLRAEAEELQRVARAFSHSPLARAARTPGRRPAHTGDDGR